MTDLAAEMIGGRKIEVIVTGIRPGEKVHEILVSDEEAQRTVHGHAGYFAIRPMLPELAGPVREPAFVGEYSSANHLMPAPELSDFLRSKLPEVMAQQSQA
jgi:UDP-glucose 4-epimerase